jgi:DUF2905 family protein
VLTDLGKMLILFGIVLVGLGVVLSLAGRLPGLPWLGRLPGDIVIRREHFVLVFPLTTCLVVSVVLSVLFVLLRR